MHPVTRAIIEGGRKASALDAFRAQYRLAELRAASRALWESTDALLLPTAGTHYRIDEEQADPLRLNSNLGRYTNFVNLMDLAAVAVPAGFTARGLPFGVTLVGRAWHDDDLLHLAGRMQALAGTPLGATGHALPAASLVPPPAAGCIDVAVCGAHMQGLPLNAQLAARGASPAREPPAVIACTHCRVDLRRAPAWCATPPAAPSRWRSGACRWSTS